VGRSGTLIDAGNSVLSATSSAGSVNINGSMIIQNNPGVTTVSAAAAKGFNGGAWNNTSAGTIYSSLAAADATHLHGVGVIQNDNGLGSTLYSSFEGSGTTTLNDSDVLVKYTYYGDTNLNGVVDGSDYGRVDTAYVADQAYLAANPGGTAIPDVGWYNGDFNYDGVVDGSDYTLMDNAFNSQSGAIQAEIASPNAVATDQIGGGASGTAAVPEPTSLGLLGIGALGLLGRRRRR